ncbi:MAG: phosphatidylglycerol lysyltransferase domain-containing protein [Bacteroidales bacterium]|nr:phosphatidylglycerol lysyltransferase domain-containing protein [Bacteroidales bacterium]
MIEFREIVLEDKEWIEKVLASSDFRGAEYCFTNLYIWQEVFKSKISRHKDFLLFTSGFGEETRYLFPPGEGDLKEVISLLEADSIERGVPFKMIGLPPEAKSMVEELFPGEFTFSATRNSFDYIYESEKMISLSGKKLQSKRNHLNRFLETPNWSYEEINPDNIQDVRDFTVRWCIANGCKENQSKMWEICAVNKALSNFFDLKLNGGLIKVDGEIVAYAAGEKINSDTLIVHIEKADSNFRGAYQAINREFAIRHATNLKFINREDDAGEEGLRKAKESYYPAFMQEKYAAFKI